MGENRSDAFTEGYIAAMRASMSPDTQDDPLAPETLAAILKDCAGGPTGPDAKALGHLAWAMRQAGKQGPARPPLTPYLGDDGKVYLKDADRG